MSEIPFGLMGGLPFEFFSRMSMAICTAESPKTFLVKVAFQMISGFYSKTMLLVTDVKQSLSLSETVKFQLWSGLPYPLI